VAICSACDPDFDALIAELGASLAPPARNAFEAAARDVLQAAGCSGVGAGYRLLRDVQRQHWDPPADDMRREGARHQRSSKLADGPPLGDDSSRGQASARARWLRGWRG
jgi:hypothetical protein